MSIIDDLKRGPFFEVRMSDMSPDAVPDPEAQGTASRVRNALGTSGYDSDLRRVNAELETWKAIAIDRGKHLDRLMIAIAQVRAELDAFPSRLAAEVAERLKASAAEHDRS
jgi:hypothetical protein